MIDPNVCPAFLSSLRCSLSKIQDLPNPPRRLRKSSVVTSSSSTSSAQSLGMVGGGREGGGGGRDKGGRKAQAQEQLEIGAIRAAFGGLSRYCVY